MPHEMKPYVVVPHPIAHYQTITIPGVAASQVLINAMPATALLTTIDSMVLKAILYIAGFLQNNFAGGNSLAVATNENTWQAHMGVGTPYVSLTPDGQYPTGAYPVNAQFDTLPFSHSFDVTPHFQGDVDGNFYLQLLNALSANGAYDLVLQDAVVLIVWDLTKVD